MSDLCQQLWNVEPKFSCDCRQEFLLPCQGSPESMPFIVFVSASGSWSYKLLSLCIAISVAVVKWSGFQLHGAQFSLNLVNPRFNLSNIFRQQETAAVVEVIWCHISYRGLDNGERLLITGKLFLGTSDCKLCILICLRVSTESRHFGPRTHLVKR